MSSSIVYEIMDSMAEWEAREGVGPGGIVCSQGVARQLAQCATFHDDGQLTWHFNGARIFLDVKLDGYEWRLTHKGNTKGES